MKKRYLALFLCTGIISLASPPEVIYVDLVTNNAVGDGFYPLHRINEEYCIKIQDYLDYMDARGMEYSNKRIKGQYNFRNYNTRLEKYVEVVPSEGEDYLKISELTNLPAVKRVEFDEDLLKMKMYLKFDLKMQDENKERVIGEEEKKEVTEEEWKLFTPGYLDLRYNNSSYSNSNATLNLDYKNQVFYGHSNVSYTVRKSDGETDIDLSRATWERDFGDGRKIVLGDVYQSVSGNKLSGDSMTGVTISRRDGWDYSSRVTKDSISGYVQAGTTIELYRNNVLIDYQISEGSNYSFDVDWKTGDRYFLRFYYPDGIREEIPVEKVNSRDMAEVGKVDYELQLGDADRGGTAYTGKVYYGFLEGLTLGVGGSSARDLNSELQDIMEFDAMSRGNLFGKAYFLRTTAIVHEDDHSTYMDFTHKLSKHFNLGVSYEDVGRMNKFYSDYEKNLDLSVGGILGPFYYSASLEREWREYNNEDIYTFSLSRSIGRFHMNLDYDKYEDYNSYSIQSSYYLRDSRLNKLIDSMGANYGITDEEDSPQSYSVYLHKNLNSYGGAAYRLSYSGGDNTEDIVSFEVSYLLDNLFEVGVNGNHKNSDSQGMYINTGVNFSKKSKVDYSSSRGDSTLKGRVFLDENADGIYQENEKLIEGMNIRTQNKTHTTSDEEGSYVLTGVTSKTERKLKVTSDDMGIHYAPPKEQYIKALPGGLLELDIPIVAMQTLSGYVEFAEDFYLEEVVEILSNSKIVATNRTTEQSYEVELRDEHYILDIPAGEYVIEMEYIGEEELNIFSYRSYVLDLKGTQSFHNKFRFKVLKDNFDGKEVYLMDITSSKDYAERIKMLVINK